MGSVVSSGQRSALQAHLGLQSSSSSSPEQTILAPKETSLLPIDISVAHTWIIQFIALISLSWS